jgi:Flp pilus assembly protein TadD
MLGRFEVAREMVAEAEGIQRDLGLEYAPFENAVRSFTVEWLAGDPGAAERELLRPDHRPTPEDFALISEVDALRARALCAQGRFDEARGLIDRDDVPGAHTWAGILWATGRAKVLASTGEFGEAERLARAAVDSAARADSPTVHGDALMDLAGVLVQAERIPEAKLAASEALSLYEHKGDIVSSGKARALVEAPDPGV